MAYDIEETKAIRAIEDSKATEARAAVRADLYNRYISYLDRKPKTIETYQAALKSLYRYMAQEGIERPTREDILAYKRRLQAQGYKAATIQAYILAARLFFKWTAQERLYPDIADRITGAEISREHKRDYLAKHQVLDILGHIDRATLTGKRDYALMLLMATAGLRTIEVARANIEDIRISGGRAVLYVQGKGQDEKAPYVKIAEPVEMAIRDYLKARGEVSANDPLFTSGSNKNKGGRMTTRSISRLVKDRLIAAGYSSDRLTAHSLRHSAATINLLEGGTLEETQQLLRHSNINTTMIYLHHIEREKNPSEDRIARAIMGA